MGANRRDTVENKFRRGTIALLSEIESEVRFERISLAREGILGDEEREGRRSTMEIEGYGRYG